MISKEINNIYLANLCGVSEETFIADKSFRIEANLVAKEKCHVNWRIIANPYSIVDIIVFDLDDHDSDFNLNIDCKEGSYVNVVIACSSKDNDKNYNIELINGERDGTSRVKFNGVNKGSGHLIFNGSTLVKNGAKKCDVRQDGRIINFSKESHSSVNPILYIKENDVKASHGAVVGSIDSGTLFYLMSRGLSKARAIDLFARGCFVSMINLLTSQEVKKVTNSRLEVKNGY